MKEGEEQAVDLVPLDTVLEESNSAATATDVAAGKGRDEHEETGLTAELVQERLGQPESAPILDIIKRCMHKCRPF